MTSKEQIRERVELMIESQVRRPSTPSLNRTMEKSCILSIWDKAHVPDFYLNSGVIVQKLRNYDFRRTN